MSTGTQLPMFRNGILLSLPGAKKCVDATEVRKNGIESQCK